jgi:hypothetical protein
MNNNWKDSLFSENENEVYTCQMIDAGHTVDGNPMRAYIVYNGPLVMGVYEDGYRGKNAIPEFFLEKMGAELFTMDVTKKFYRTLVGKLAPHSPK